MKNANQPVVILGASGHARVVADILTAQGRSIAAVVGTCEGGLWSVPVWETDEEAIARAAEAEMAFIAAIGDNTRRRSVYERFIAAGIHAATAVHPRAYVAATATCGAGTVVAPMAVIGADAEVGADSIVNTGAIVEHNCKVGDHAHIAPGTRLGGAVTVGQGALIGIGSTVLPGISIGAEAIVAAGAAVVRDVDAGSTVVGVPARSREGSRKACTV